MLRPSDLAQALKPVAETLKGLGVPYYIGGSVASSAYGLARATLDVDMVSNLKLEHVRPFVDALQDDYYVSEELILFAIRNSSSFNLLHLVSGLKIDVFISKGRAYDQSARQRAREDTLSDEDDAPRFYLASPEDVILAKLEWFKIGGQTSERQWNDILGVLRVQGASIETSYLKQWATHLEVSELLEKALREA